MLKTLRISFALKNTYRVNGILHSLKQIPLLKRVLPDRLYQVRGLKIFANILSVLWEIVSIFLGKLLYFLTMVCGVGLLCERAPAGLGFLHILLFLTLIGSYMNTSLFNPTRDKYYAMILLRMNAQSYTLSNYGYALGKVVVGFLPFTIFFGLDRGVPLWLCLLIPFCIAGAKVAVAADSLRDYEKHGYVRNENNLQKIAWLLTALLLALAYVLPAVGFVLPLWASAALFLVWIPLGLLSFRQVVRFPYYREMNQELLAQIPGQMDKARAAVKTANEKNISADTSITSQKKGFEFLNDLFVKRHRKILWKSALRIAYVCLFLCCGAVLLMVIQPGARADINEMVMTWLPYFAFIMYLINRGTGFTAGDHQGQRRAGAGDRVRPGADPLCLRRDGQPPRLCGAGGHDPRHERLLLHPLPDRLLPAAALHGRHGIEERDLPHCDGAHLCGVLRPDQRPHAHSGVRRDVHRLLCGVLHRGQRPGLQVRAPDLPAADVI